jgi:hypothetical protein
MELKPFSSAHWRERAAEARLVAESMSDPDAKRILLEISRGYEQLADGAKRGRERAVMPKGPRRPAR